MADLFHFYGIATDPWQMQNIPQAQLNYLASRQQNSPYDPREVWESLRNYNPHLPPERPLDERFADFKVRLAAAISRKPS